MLNPTEGSFFGVAFLLPQGRRKGNSFLHFQVELKGKRNNRKIVLLGFDYAEKNITQLYNRLHTAVQGELQANKFAVFSFLLRNETVSR